MSAFAGGRVDSVPGWGQVFRKILPNHVRRLLVATAGFGDGHNRAAEAVRLLLVETRPEIEVLVVDLLCASGPEGEVPRRDAYYALLRRCPRVYHLAYRTFSCVPGVLTLLGRPYRRPLAELFEEVRPDALLATHMFAASAAESLRCGGPYTPILGVLTDWFDDAYWNRTRLEHYLVASEGLKKKLLSAGLPRERVHVTGIPLAPSFYRPQPRREARRALGLDPDRFTVLVLGGGLGLGPLQETASLLCRSTLPIQVVVGTGRNEELRARIEALKPSAAVPLRAIPFTERMHDYMSAADLAVTKPGGVTTSECAAKGLPMVFLGAPLPGPETLNEGYLLAEGLAVKLPGPEKLPAWVEGQLTLALKPSAGAEKPARAPLRLA